jgi:hypothetical protein
MLFKILENVYFFFCEEKTCHDERSFLEMKATPSTPRHLLKLRAAKLSGFFCCHSFLSRVMMTMMLPVNSGVLLLQGYGVTETCGIIGHARQFGSTGALVTGVEAKIVDQRQ